MKKLTILFSNNKNVSFTDNDCMWGFDEGVTIEYKDDNTLLFFPYHNILMVGVEEVEE